jgi:hypothetical protein
LSEDAPASRCQLRVARALVTLAFVGIASGCSHGGSPPPATPPPPASGPVLAPAETTSNSSPTPQKKASPPMIEMSREPPPRVPPVSHKGVRYEQVKNARALGFDQVTGYLAAYDEASGKQLWTVRLYDNAPSPGIETDVQEVYFKSMELRPGADEIVVTNEDDKRFVVNLASHTVRTAP